MTGAGSFFGLRTMVLLDMRPGVRHLTHVHKSGFQLIAYQRLGLLKSPGRRCFCCLTNYFPEKPKCKLHYLHYFIDALASLPCPATCERISANPLTSFAC